MSTTFSPSMSIAIAAPTSSPEVIASASADLTSTNLLSLCPWRLRCRDRSSADAVSARWS
jgi:hypothetical protein